MVVSGGTKFADSGMSKPTTLTSPGTSRPASSRARSTPSAIWSLAAKIAVRGVLGQSGSQRVDRFGAPVSAQRWGQRRAGGAQVRLPRRPAHLGGR